jgi:hypothetical protein
VHPQHGQHPSPRGGLHLGHGGSAEPPNSRKKSTPPAPRSGTGTATMPTKNRSCPPKKTNPIEPKSGWWIRLR